MIVHQVFAQIYNEKVQNVIICEDYETANWLSRQIYGKDAFAVNCQQYPCEVGDTYRDGCFYKVDKETGEESLIVCQPTSEQQVEALLGELQDTKQALAEQNEKNASLQDELTNVQMALVELFESGGGVG